MGQPCLKRKTSAGRVNYPDVDTCAQSVARRGYTKRSNSCNVDLVYVQMGVCRGTTRGCADHCRTRGGPHSSPLFTGNSSAQQAVCAVNLLLNRQTHTQVKTESGSSDPANFDFYSHQKTFENFVAALASHKQPLIDGREGRRSVELILAIYEVAASGQQVALPLEQDPDSVQARVAQGQANA